MSEPITWPTQSDMERFMRAQTGGLGDRISTNARILFAQLPGSDTKRFYLVVSCSDGNALRETSCAVFRTLCVTPDKMKRASTVSMAMRQPGSGEDVWIATLRFTCSGMGIDTAVIDRLLAEEP